MSFAVDQFIQVKCKFQLTSESESSDSVHMNRYSEKIGICTASECLNHTLLVMVCSNEIGNNHIVAYYIEKNRTIIKQIYYHNYNEDIVAICLTESGNRLALINASSTIYILPISNILLNSSQGKHMYLYDASIIDCCDIDNPVGIVFWESLEVENKSTVIVGGQRGDISFISVEEKKVVSNTSINEPIRNLKIVKDRFGYSLLITGESFKQYRTTLELVNPQQQDYDFEAMLIQNDVMPSWNRHPIPIKLRSSGGSNGSSNTSNTSSIPTASNNSTAVALQRALVPSMRVNSHSNLFSSLQTRYKSLPLIFYHSTNIISVVDILGANKITNSLTLTSSASKRSQQNPESRLFRFFSNRHFYYRPQKPLIVCKLDSLDPNEMITHLVLTDRFLAVATTKDRCLINSRNCCNLKNSNSSIDLDSMVKEIVFNNEEKILLLLKSPVCNDQDGIIDSFLLVTNRSIYSIEARQSCRDMFINLIDEHLGIKITSNQSHLSSLLSTESDPTEYDLKSDFFTQRRSSVNLLIDNFLNNRDEVYERVCFDSKAFSILFKLDLCSLYEAYGDRLLLRGQFVLANRFFQMAKFNHQRILGKYTRLGATVATHSFQLVKIGINEPKFTKLVTSPEVTKALVRNLSFTSEFVGYQPQKLLLSKPNKCYSYAALCQLDSYRRFILTYHQDNPDIQIGRGRRYKLFTKEQKQSIKNIFFEFLSACVEESLCDSYRLWFYYINFYLNYVAPIKKLEDDILNLLTRTRDCRFSITLYQAIDRESTFAQVIKETTAAMNSRNDIDSKSNGSNRLDNPLESMSKLYNLSDVFKNYFLMKLLEKTLEVIPNQNQWSKMDSINSCLGVGSLMSCRFSPSVDNNWPQILKSLASVNVSESLPSTSTNSRSESIFR